MASFIKYDEQQVYQVVIESVGSKQELKVGDVFSYNPASAEFGAKITTKAAAVEALADQKELYLIAQSDAVTYKTGTESIKHYDIARSVTLDNAVISEDEPHIVAAYRITNIDNVEGLE